MGIVENTLSPNSAFPSISYLNAYLDLSFPLMAAAVIARSLAGALMEDARKMAHVSEAHLGGDCADRHIRILQQIDRLCDAVCDQVLVDRFAGMLHHLLVQIIGVVIEVLSDHAVADRLVVMLLDIFDHIIDLIGGHRSGGRADSAAAEYLGQHIFQQTTEPHLEKDQLRLIFLKHKLQIRLDLLHIMQTDRLTCGR